MGSAGLLEQMELELIREALVGFSQEAGNLMFNTAGVQNAVARRFPELGCPDAGLVAGMLRRNSRIVELYGGAHWLVLPDGLQRQMP